MLQTALSDPSPQPEQVAGSLQPVLQGFFGLWPRLLWEPEVRQVVLIFRDTGSFHVVSPTLPSVCRHRCRRRDLGSGGCTQVCVSFRF